MQLLAFSKYDECFPVQWSIYGHSSCFRISPSGCAVYIPLAEEAQSIRQQNLRTESGDPMDVSPVQFLNGRRSIRGWTSGQVKDSEDATRFSVLTDVGSMIETYPQK